MGLKVPKIDDVTFARFVEEAIKRIPQYTEEWTDHNIHDPGITLIELLAWLAEMQVFYLDQLTERHYLKFLKLLGVKPRPALPSRVRVTFTSSNEQLLESGTELEATVDEESIPFETVDNISVIPVSLKKILISSENTKRGKILKWIDIDSLSADMDNYFYAFGENPTEDSVMYLGFDKNFPKDKEICLALSLYEKDLPPRGQHDEEPDIIPSASTVWEYSRDGSWYRLDMLDDSTLAFSQSGFIKFRLPSTITQTDVEGEKYFWLRCRLEEAKYEIPPRIEYIRLNTVEALQMRKLKGQEPENITALPNQFFKLNDSPVVPRKLVLKVKEGRKWIEWKPVENFEKSGKDDEHYVLCYEKNKIMFGDKKRGRIPPKGINNIRLISYIDEEPAEKKVFSSTGKKSQILELNKFPPILKDVFLHVGKIKCENEKEEIEEWKVWNEVSDFDASKPEDRHFTLDLARGEVQLGTGLRGRIDPGDRIEAACYYCTRGEKGSVKKGTITTIVDSLGKYGDMAVTNFEDASAGKDAEKLDEAIVRACKDLKKPYRAVTLDDFEYLAKATPGLRIARTKAVWSNNTVKVIVVPHRLPNNRNVREKSSEGFKKTVCLHLDKHRVLTTRLEVVDPEYVIVSVSATVKIKPLASADLVKQRVTEELETFFDPLKGYGGSGWPFGRSVYKSEVCAKIEKVDGVDCVQDLVLIAEGDVVYKDGNVKIGKDALVCSVEHQVKIVEALEPCKGELR
jgi:hypothetical protein